MTSSTKHVQSTNQDLTAFYVPIATPVAPVISPRPSLSGTSTTWTSTTGGNFNTAANWSNGVPVAGIDATIDEASTDSITVTLSGVNDTADAINTQYAGLSLINATLTLQGAINGSDGSNISTGSGTALTQSGGLLDFQNGPSGNDASSISSGGGGVVQTSGIIEVDAGTLTIAGNSSFAGTITGTGDKPDSGIVVLAGGSTYNFNAGAVVSVGEVSIIGTSNVNLNEALTYQGNFIQSGGSTLNIGAHVFTLDDTEGTLSSVAGLITGTQLTNETVLSLGGATLSSGTTLSNSGTLLVNQGGGLALTLGNGGTAASLLANTTGGTIAVQSGNDTIAGGTFTNAALLQLSGSSTLSTSSTFTNSGTISIATGDAMYVNAPFSSTGAITGAGLFELNPGGIDYLRAGTTVSVGEFEINGVNSSVTVTSSIASITAGTFFLFQAINLDLTTNLSYGGVFIDEGYAGASSVNLGTATMTLSGTNLFDATNFGSDLFTGTGTLLTSGSTSITIAGLGIGEGTTLANSGKLYQAASVALGDTNGVGYGSNSATGTWDVIGNAELGANVNNAVSNPYSTFSNAGLFEMTATGDVATVNALFTNTGNIATSIGAVTDFIDTLTNAGTISGAGEFEITAGTTTLGTASTISVGTLAVGNGGVLTLGKSLSYTGTFTDFTSGATGLNLGGTTLTLSGTSNFGTYNGTTVIDGPGTLVLASANTTLIPNSNIVLGGGVALQNTGTVLQDGTLQIGDNSGTSASVTNSAGGTWTLALGNGINRGTNFSTQFTNAGLFQDTELGSPTSVYSVFSNTGTIAVTGTELDFYSTFSNSGSITGTGAIGLSGSASGTWAGGSVVKVAQFNLYDESTLTLGSNISYGGFFNDQGYNTTTLNLGGHLLTLSKTADFGSSVNYAVVEGPGTLSLTGTTTITNSNAGLELGGTVTLLNSGLLTQNGQFQIGDSSGASASVTNSAKGTWAIATSNGISTGSNGASSFTNLGLFKNTGSLDSQTVSAVFTNGGTIAVASGDSTNFVNSFSNNGTISGAGQFDLTNSAIGTFAAGEVISVAEIGLYQEATLDLTTNLTYAGLFNDQGYNTTTLNLASNTLSLTGQAVFGASVSDAYVGGSGTLSLSGTTTITSSNDGIELGGTAAIINSGYVLQNGQVQIGDGSGALASITNSAGGTWAMATGNGISTGSNSNSSFTNNGLLENTSTGSTQSISAVLSNAATLSIAAGDATTILNNFTNTGTISGAGQFDINNSAVATFAAGSVVSVGEIGLYSSATLDLATSLTYAGLFNDQGYDTTTLNLGSNTLSLTGQAVFGASVTDAYVGGSGTLSLSGTTTITQANDGLEIGGTTALINSGTVTQSGGLQIGDGSGNIATVTNTSTGTWKLGTSNTISTGNDASSSFSNAGLVVNIGTGNTETISAVFNNTGTLTDTNFGSTIALADGGSIGGTLSGAGAIDFNGGAFTLATATALKVASLGIYDNGTEVTLAGAASYAGTLTEGSGATINLSAAAATLTLTGQDTLDGSVIGAGTVLLSTGGTLIADSLTLGGSAILKDSGGTIAQGQNITIGNSSASKASLSIAAGSTYEITNNVVIGSDGLGGIANAGTFSMLQGTGTSTIDPIVTNTGTINSSSGTLAFASNFTNNKLVTASNGHEVVFDSSVNATGTSTGTIALTSGGLAAFGGFVGSAETLSFTDGSSSLATLESPTNFDGTISGFAGSNELMLSDFDNATTGATYSGGVLTLIGENGSTAETIQLHFSGTYTLGNFSIENNNAGGTDILYKAT